MSIDSYFRKEVLDTPAYHLETHQGVKLNQNESPWDVPVEIKARVAEELLRIPWNRYPLEDPVILKKMMAKYLGLWPDNLAVANGSNVLIQAITIATSVQRSVMVVDPTFSVYEIEGKLMGNKIIRVPLNDEDFSFPIDLFLKTMKREKPGVIFIPCPNAPTGTMFDPDLILKVVHDADCLVVVDEAYFPFSGFTFADRLKDFENLVILRTFSKAFALGGIRLGYMLAEPEVSQQVQKCLLPFCLSKLAYATILAVLEHPDYMNDYAKALCSERDRVYLALSQMPGLKVYPSQANFLLFEIEKADLVFKKLLQKEVILRQVNDGRRLTRALRVTIGTPEENDVFLRAIRPLAG